MYDTSCTEVPEVFSFVVGLFFPCFFQPLHHCSAPYIQPFLAVRAAVRFDFVEAIQDKARSAERVSPPLSPLLSGQKIRGGN